MSLDLERLLCRMIAPNADLRCTATGAMADDYWHRRNGVDMHRMLCSLIYGAFIDNNQGGPQAAILVHLQLSTKIWPTLLRHRQRRSTGFLTHLLV
jgi:hypothetical protein